MGLQATNAGIDFQQRVSAFMMILMEFEIDISMVLQLNSKEKIIELNFEACENIDDLVMTLESGKKIYFQMKRTISLSESEDSEFYGVCTQFVKQYLTQNSSDLAYILCTRSEASNAITVKLKRILNGMRLAHDFKIISGLNNEEKNIFDKLCNNIKKIYKNIKQQEISNQELLELILRIYVEIFDVESGEEYEKNIKLILFNKVHVDVELFWQALIAKAINYGANRRCVSKDALKTQFDIYLSENQVSENTSEQFFTHTWENDVKDLEVKLDYVVAVPTEATKQEMDLEENTVFAFELYRFNDSERKKNLVYETNNIMKWSNSGEFHVLFRCGTKDRFHKFIEEELSQFVDNKYELVYCPIKKLCDDTEVELLHKEILIKSFESQKKCKCINCGKAIFEDNAYIIEIDNQECTNTAGIVHKMCVRPIDRIIGEIKITKIDDYVYLKNFDISIWSKLIRKGQQAWGNIDNINSKCPSMVINTDEVFHDGNYCVCNILKNGDKRYTTHRGVIDRLSKREAKEIQQGFNNSFKKGRDANNPVGYSSKSFTYGPYEQLIEQLGDKESFIECVEAKVELYNEVIAKIYNDCETFYAPIIYLAIDGEPLVLPNYYFPMITNPFDLQKYLDNWSNMGIDISGYEVCIIKDDNEFILKMISLITNNVRPIVNGLFSSNGKMLRGIMMYLMWELKEENEASIYINEK
ncbi:hypothetical protein NE452_01765 [Paeniclostridium sordellii]|nr:hypothetical protein [Paeniclostridium sordellii]